MVEPETVRVTAGLRVGFWNPNGGHYTRAFIPKGYYTGPDLGNHTIGATLEQKLMEGTLRFSVGVLFRPDLGRNQKLETILILENYVPEMFEYQDWETDLAIAE